MSGVQVASDARPDPERIAIDLDEVLYPLVVTLTDILNRECGRSVSLRDYDEYDFDAVWHLGQDEAASVIERHFGTTEPLAIPLPGAGETIQRLAGEYTLFVVSSRPPRLQAVTERWIDTFFPDCFEDVVLTGNSYEMDPVPSKGSVCSAMGVDALIDDQDIHLLSAAASGLMPIRFGDYPWQRLQIESCVRLRDWSSVLEYFTPSTPDSDTQTVGRRLPNPANMLVWNSMSRRFANA